MEGREAWKEAKKYIINHLNPNWTDPTLLKSGYNISSLLHLIRESTFHHDAHEDAKDNVRCGKKREKAKGNNNWKDINNSAYNEKYNNKIEKLKKEGWYPDSWFTFLAFGAPSKFPAPSLYTSRIKVEDNLVITRLNGKRTIEEAITDLAPTPDSDIYIHSKVKKFQKQIEDDDDYQEVIIPNSAITSSASFQTIRNIKKEDDNKSKKIVPPKFNMQMHAANMKVQQRGKILLYTIVDVLIIY
jgi:hypothetical protein